MRRHLTIEKLIFKHHIKNIDFPDKYFFDNIIYIIFNFIEMFLNISFFVFSLNILYIYKVNTACLINSNKYSTRRCIVHNIFNFYYKQNYF